MLLTYDICAQRCDAVARSPATSSLSRSTSLRRSWSCLVVAALCSFRYLVHRASRLSSSEFAPTGSLAAFAFSYFSSVDRIVAYVDRPAPRIPFFDLPMAASSAVGVVARRRMTERCGIADRWILVEVTSPTGLPKPRSSTTRSAMASASRSSTSFAAPTRSDGARRTTDALVPWSARRVESRSTWRVRSCITYRHSRRVVASGSRNVNPIRPKGEALRD